MTPGKSRSLVHQADMAVFPDRKRRFSGIMAQTTRLKLPKGQIGYNETQHNAKKVSFVRPSFSPLLTDGDSSEGISLRRHPRLSIVIQVRGYFSTRSVS